jgi:hypothetical protein
MTPERLSSQPEEPLRNVPVIVIGPRQPPAGRWPGTVLLYTLPLAAKGGAVLLIPAATPVPPPLPKKAA